ncbi:MAG: glycosyltransferase [Hyphomicrobiales bacterium]|nr:glycosyltransferase [Hyphomicrobiales bacterium]
MYIDHTHCGRHVTGLERITLELFSPQALAPLEVQAVTASTRLGMMARQNLDLPARLALNPSALLICPGFPPAPLASLFGARVLPYIHDLFLLTRPQDLNIRARLAMRPPFALAVRHLPRFLVNSETTAGALRGFCRPDAAIHLYRPQVRDVFDLAGAPRPPRSGGGLRLIALGTLEPRKNLDAAVAILAALHRQGHADACLDIVGRPGWGVDMAALASVPGVTLHGYQPLQRVRELIGDADALISTAHDEGLGLPLLEAQYAGLQVIAPDKPVFREVLATSGLFIDPAASDIAAAAIARGLAAPPAERAAAASANLQRWSHQAAADSAAVIALIARLTGQTAMTSARVAPC